MVGLSIVTIADGPTDEEMAVNPRILRWFEDRGISHETVLRTGIFSGKHHRVGDSFEVRPDPLGNVIVYPYKRHGQVLSEKYRSAPKRFYQRPNGQKIFWNADILDDPSLHDGSNALVIVEGENDALALIQSGYPFVVSVPDGAPPPRKGPLADIDPDHDDKFSYVFEAWEDLKKIKQIIIAVDADEPGNRLAEELVRRLGKVRCRFVTLPPDAKDLNDLLLSYGPTEVLDAIKHARPYPVSGLYTLNTLPPEPDLEPMSTGWGRMDHLIRLFYPSLLVVTGTANSGKSTFVNQMVAQMSLEQGVRVGIASFEMRIRPFITDTLTSVHREARARGDVDQWMNDRFVFIAPEPGEDSDSFDIEWLLEKAAAAVIRYGIRILVVDPWNEIEHAVGRKESHTDYIGRAIRSLKRFGREYEVLVILVAHPSKWGASKDPENISLYDISDSAHFANKADFGIVVARIGTSFESMIKVVKVRYQPLTGTIGSCPLTYDPQDRVFSQ